MFPFKGTDRWNVTLGISVSALQTPVYGGTGTKQIKILGRGAEGNDPKSGTSLER